MTGKKFSRRALMQGAAALGTAALIPQGLSAQQVARTASAQGAPLPGRGELIIRGVTVLTMDPAVPDLAAGDVHVREGAIVAVAPRIEAPAAQVIDGAGMICIPGFVDTHFHLWNALFRLFIRADVPALGYFPVTARLGPLMQPEDSYRSVRLGAAEALAAGVTTVHNWSHNTRSPEHADAELSGMRDMGIRGRFAYGTPVGMADDTPMDFAGLARVKKDWMPDKDNLLTLGICSRNLGALTIGGSAAAASRGVLTIEQIKRDWDGARALGLPITMHTSGASPITALEGAGLLGPDVQFVHPLLTTPEERAIMKARGVSYSMSPQLEARRASQLGVIQLGELLESGVKVSLSTDHIASISCDPFASMRILFALHLHRIGAKVPLTLKRLLQLATLDGAVDLGIADRTGSITPGKRADLVLVRTTDINTSPAGDPYEAIVSLGHARERGHRDRRRSHPASRRQVHRLRPCQDRRRGARGGHRAARQGQVADLNVSDDWRLSGRQHHEISPPNFSASGRGRCRAAVRVTDRLGAELPNTAGAHPGRLRRRASDRHHRSYRRPIAVGPARSAIRHREPPRRRGQSGGRSGGALTPGRLHAARRRHEQHDQCHALRENSASTSSATSRRSRASCGPPR